MKREKEQSLKWRQYDVWTGHGGSVPDFSSGAHVNSLEGDHIQLGLNRMVNAGSLPPLPQNPVCLHWYIDMTNWSLIGKKLKNKFDWGSFPLVLDVNFVFLLINLDVIFQSHFHHNSYFKFCWICNKSIGSMLSDSLYLFYCLHVLILYCHIGNNMKCQNTGMNTTSPQINLHGWRTLFKVLFANTLW